RNSGSRRCNVVRGTSKSNEIAEKHAHPLTKILLLFPFVLFVPFVVNLFTLFVV
ncbi:MAG: hypothetical protein RIS70_2426, partial [Planctomycetota bacterium]